MLFSSAGMISSSRIHLWLVLLFCRDDFFLPDSSPACSFLPQGLFLPPEFIPSVLFSSAGIISSFRIHLWRVLFFRRDDFFRSDSSPAYFFFRRDYFFARIHLWIALFFRRDYLFRPNSSLNDRFCVQGCILPTKCIPDELFFRTEIITCLTAEKNQKTLYFQRLQPFSLKVQGS